MKPASLSNLVLEIPELLQSRGWCANPLNDQVWDYMPSLPDRSETDRERYPTGIFLAAEDEDGFCCVEPATRSTHINQNALRFETQEHLIACLPQIEKLREPGSKNHPEAHNVLIQSGASAPPRVVKNGRHRSTGASGLES